ncbi:MAG: glycosyl hydrolase family 28-related protein, partial [Victivallales bacterium]
MKMNRIFAVGMLTALAMLAFPGGLDQVFAQESKAPEKGAVKKSVETLQVPSLNWEKRSDWLNVKDAGAVGDGAADDTAAIQAMLDRLSDSNDMLKNARCRNIYFPPGRYRITKTLEIRNSTGAYLVGHGRETVLFWDGEQAGNLIWSNGSHYARYEGFVLDGKNKASIAVLHHSMTYYETSLRYQHCEFRNFTEGGVVVGKGAGKGLAESKNQSAEIWFNNCIFRNCGAGASFLQFNDYDNFFDGCHFEDCGIGVNSTRGNFAVRNCSFERSKEVDVRQASPSHACAVRWSTSRGSKKFFDTGIGMHQSFTAQDCRVDGWTGKDGAFSLGHRGPSTIFDCVFTNPPDNLPPVRLINRENTEAQLIVSNNISKATKYVVAPGLNSKITEIPDGKLSSCLKDAKQVFFRTTAKIPGKVFDAVKDFNARGNGSVDDSDAIQNCINAAKAHGKGAIAYLPGGSYKITKTILVDGSDYYIGSTGFCSYLKWASPTEGVMMAVADPQNVTIEHLSLYQAPKTVVQIRQT